MQQRKAGPEEFQELLRRVVGQLEEMPSTQRLRWLELLSYIHALVYHERNRAEHESLQEKIEDSVRTDEHRKDLAVMGRTMAEELRKEGQQEGRKQEAVHSRQRILSD